MNMRTAVLRKLRVMSLMEFMKSETLKADQSLAFSEEMVKTGIWCHNVCTGSKMLWKAKMRQMEKGYGTGAVTYRLTDKCSGCTDR